MPKKPSKPFKEAADQHASNITSIIMICIKYTGLVIIVTIIGLFYKYDGMQLKSIGEKILLWGSIYVAGMGTPFTIKKAFDFIKSLLNG